MKKILIVGDSLEELELLEEMLRQQGLYVLMASTAKEAALKNLLHKVNLVLTDFRTNEPDGEWLLSELKTQDPHTKVVVISDVHADRNKILGLGAEAFVARPYIYASLINIVMSLLAS